MSDIAATVKKCIAKQLGVPEEQVTPLHTFDALGADSLDMCELEMFIEDELELDNLDGEVPVATETTVEAYIAAVEKYVAEHPKTTIHFQH